VPASVAEDLLAGRPARFWTADLEPQLARLHASDHVLVLVPGGVKEARAFRSVLLEMGKGTATPEPPAPPVGKLFAQAMLRAGARALARREDELDTLARRATVTEEQSTENERRVAEREAELNAREQELRGREAEVLRLQAGLAAQQESVRSRERSIEDAERALARETVAPATAHVSFSEGLEALTGWRPRRD